MQLKTILNRCHKFKSFVYAQARFVGEVIEVTVLPRANAKAICSHCEEPAAVYDHLAERRFEFIPIWGYRVFFLYRMRRVDCRDCGVKVERVPWARGKRELTDTYQQFLAHWAEKLSWLEVARSFRTSWEKVFQAVEFVVQWGLEHRDLSEVAAPGEGKRSARWARSSASVLTFQQHCASQPIPWFYSPRSIFRSAHALVSMNL